MQLRAQLCAGSANLGLPPHPEKGVDSETGQSLEGARKGPRMARRGDVQCAAAWPPESSDLTPYQTADVSVTGCCEGHL